MSMSDKQLRHVRVVVQHCCRKSFCNIMSIVSKLYDLAINNRCFPSLKNFSFTITAIYILRNLPKNHDS